MREFSSSLHGSSLSHAVSMYALDIAKRFIGRTPPPKKRKKRKKTHHWWPCLFTDKVVLHFNLYSYLDANMIQVNIIVGPIFTVKLRKYAKTNICLKWVSSKQRHYIIDFWKNKIW